MIDVSSYQGTPNWQKIYAAGVRKAYIKATEGSSVIDSRLKWNVRDARQAGIEVGLYHFAHPANSPSVEARFFLRAAGVFIRPGDLPPALDLELQEGHDWTYLRSWKAEWFKAVDAAVGVRAVFYSYFSFWQQMNDLFKDRPIWGADLRPGFKPPETWAFHQYSFTGRVDGIAGSVDLDRVIFDPPRVKEEVAG